MLQEAKLLLGYW